MPGVIEAVNVVSALHRSPGTVGVTAIDKRPVEGAVAVRPYGLYRDVQADRKHHGGLFQAVYSFSREEYGYWQGQFGREISAGSSGRTSRRRVSPWRIWRSGRRCGRGAAGSR